MADDAEGARAPTAPDDARVPDRDDPQSREVALEQLRGPRREIRSSAEAERSPPLDLGHPTLSALARLRPFMAYFCWLADRQFPASHRPETRVASHRAKNRALYALCVALDLVVLAVVIAFVFRAAYKSVWL